MKKTKERRKKIHIVLDIFPEDFESQMEMTMAIESRLGKFLVDFGEEIFRQESLPCVGDMWYQLKCF